MCVCVCMCLSKKIWEGLQRKALRQQRRNASISNKDIQHVNFESMVGLAYIQLVSTILVSILFFSKPNPDQPYLRGAPDSVDELERSFQSLPPQKINQ